MTGKVTRTLAKNVRAIEGVRPERKRVAYTIKGERGLRLIVHPTGRKVWFGYYQRGAGASRVRRWHEIGDATLIPLPDACTENRSLQAQVADGADPEAAKTFGELFQAWLEEHAKKKLATWPDEERRYKMHMAKPLGAKAITDIERKDVRELRDDVAENAGPIQSNRVVALFNRVMNWAVDEDRAKFNPAARLKKVGQEQRRERVLTPDELRRIWAELDRPLEGAVAAGKLTLADLPATLALRRALKLLAITGQRRGEVIGMRRAELDLTDGDAWWSLPGERTKNGLPHRVPLTGMAVDVLREAMEAAGDSEFVFPSHRTEKAIIPDAVTKQLQRICRKLTPRIEGVGPHDLRRTAGQTMRKLGVSVEDRGYVLNHVPGAKAKVTSWNYDPGEHDQEKRVALEKWEREMKRVVGMDSAVVVVPLRRA